MNLSFRLYFVTRPSFWAIMHGNGRYFTPISPKRISFYFLIYLHVQKWALKAPNWVALTEAWELVLLLFLMKTALLSGALKIIGLLRLLNESNFLGNLLLFTQLQFLALPSPWNRCVPSRAKVNLYWGNQFLMNSKYKKGLLFWLWNLPFYKHEIWGPRPPKKVRSWVKNPSSL